MGDGTEESHKRIQKAVDELWDYTTEFFEMDALDEMAVADGIGIDTRPLKDAWKKMIAEIFSEATIQIPSDGKQITGSKNGKHTEHLKPMLKEMQGLQREYPGAKW